MPRDVVPVGPELAALVARRAGGEPFDVRAECARIGVSTKTFYKYVKRFKVEGVDGLYPRSRRPSMSPTRIDPAIGDAIVEARKELDGDGWDAGAEQIAFWLSDHDERFGPGARVPSRSTINRTLTRRGLIVAVPKRRPRSAIRRFEAEQPNTMWQLDGFGFRLADGTEVTVLQIIDDCSRMDLALRAVSSENSQDAWMAVLWAIQRFGLPRRFLTDNGVAFSGRRRGWISNLEENLCALNVLTITSTIGHPQTNGKVERAHQTCLKWLEARPAPQTLAELQELLDYYRDRYNFQRRKTHLGGLTPAQRYELGPRDGPGTEPVPWPVTTSTALVNARGCIRIDAHTISVGRAHAGTTMTLIKQHRDIVVLNHHRLIDQFTLTGQRGYQRRPPATPQVLPMS